MKPSAKIIRWYVHPLSWVCAKIFAPFGVRVTRDQFSGVSGVTFTPKKHSNPDTLIVFFHGGGYCFGSSLTTHRVGLTSLSKITGSICHSIDYRLAPEHPHPAALDDAKAAWREILARNPNSKIILSGDSAGGGLCLALMMYLRDSKEKLPDGAVLFSPWTDLNCESESYSSKAKVDPMFIPKMTRDCSNYYVPKTVDRNHPYISPVFGDFTGLPKMLIMTGENEILLDDSKRIGEKAEEAGIEINVEIWPAMFHDWWLFGGFIPETKQCLNNFADWMS